MHIFAANVWNPRLRPPKHRHRRCPMVTPVHRFQRIESMLIETRGRVDGSRGRVRSERHYNRRRRWGRSPTAEEDESVRVHLADSQCATLQTEMSSQYMPPSSLLPQISETSSSLPNNFNRFRMGGVNWGLWVCFIIVTALLVPAHLYLKKYEYRGELIGIIFVITLLFLVCFSVSMFHTKTRAILLHRLHLEEGFQPYSLDVRSALRQRHFHSSSTNYHRGTRSSRRPSPNVHNNRDSNESSHQPESSSDYSQDNNVSSHGLYDPDAEPPPYHVAILLPPPPCDTVPPLCETPPPAYEVLK